MSFLYKNKTSFFKPEGDIAKHSKYYTLKAYKSDREYGTATTSEFNLHTLAIYQQQTRDKNRSTWKKCVESRRKNIGPGPKGLTQPCFSPFFFSLEIFCPDFINRQKIKSHMQISRVSKISLSYTGKSLVNSPTELVAPMAALELIAAQRCTVVWAIQSVSTWKLRKNSVIGCKVTLRGKSALLFLQKLYIYVICVNVGEKNASFVDRYGNIHFGVSNNSCFHELQKSSSFWTGFSGFSISITQTPPLHFTSTSSSFAKERAILA
jgi:large subunit ribosomal protein L5